MTTEASPPAPRSARLTSLDGLRGIAAVVVLLHHSLLVVPLLATPYYEGTAAPENGTWAWWLIDTPLHILWEGKGAVYVFFVLSGIVLTLPVLKAAGFSWRGFYPSRMIRLYLPVWAAVVFTVLTIQLIPRSGTEGSDWLQARINTVTPANFIKDMTLVLGNGGLASPLWSLRWEILFSLALPIFVWAACKWARLNWVKLIACAAVVSIGGVTGNPILLYLPMFLVGSLLAIELPTLRSRFEQFNTRREARMMWAAALLVAIVLLTSRWLMLGAGAPVFVLDATAGVMLVGASLLVVWALYSPSARAFLDRSSVQWLGRISFSLYLIHEPIVIASAYLFGPGLEWAAVTAAVPTAVVVGWLFYRLIELPSYRLAKFARARARAHAPGPAVPVD